MTATDALQVTPCATPGADSILTPGALAFVFELHRRFDSRRRELLAVRSQQNERWQRGERPDFLPETQELRAAEWKCAPVPPEVADRRVEITGPVDRKMVINALNSGARVFMADFEDSNTPRWENQIAGQVNLHDAIRGTISYTSPEGKGYRLNAQTATLMVRPRGWHLPEVHISAGGQPTAGALVDFGLFTYHNAQALLQRGSRPYFYFPKLESYLEARLWAEVMAFTEEYLQLPKSTLRCTVLIETILATFQLHEILYELRDYCIGLNCGRWDYIFSYIKKLGHQPWALLPDRAQVTMDTHFLRSYSRLVIQTCHRRGVHAMGGMAAQIPIKGDAEANERAMNKIRADKEREARDGHDGTWVAHPALVPVAQEVFDRLMPQPNQYEVLQADFHPTAQDLLTPPQGTITEAGLRANAEVAMIYLESWLGGNGCVPIHHLMEDAATAEIARAQLWQVLRHPHARLADGAAITSEKLTEWVDEEYHRLAATGQYLRLERAYELLKELVFSDQFTEFLTLPAYQLLE